MNLNAASVDIVSDFCFGLFMYAVMCTNLTAHWLDFLDRPGFDTK